MTTTTTTGTDQVAGTRFLDIHVLLSSSYANLNRDDLGQPKTCHFGGVERARVSSQCQKRAARMALGLEGAERSRRLPGSVADALADTDWHPDMALYAACRVLVAAGFGPHKGSVAETSVLTFVPEGTGAGIAAAVAEHAPGLQEALDGHDIGGLCPPEEIEHDDEREAHDAWRTAAAAKPAAKDASESFKALHQQVTAVFDEHIASNEPLTEAVKAQVGRVNPTIALFGRMLTAMPAANVDGAVQVAHAVSTHRVDLDTDYFTAVDDLAAGDEPGAGMIGTPDYVSAVYYRYATVDVAGLRKLLEQRCDGDAETAAVAAAFAAAFAARVSDAKRTSCGPPPRPSLVLVVARDDAPCSYVNAFEAPVEAADGGGYLAASASRLLAEAGCDRDDPGVTAAWLFVAPGLAETLDDDIASGLFEHDMVTLHSLEAGVAEGIA